MQRFINVSLILVVLSAIGLAVATGTRAAQPEPQPVTLECATNMRALTLGTTQPASADGQSLVLVRAIFEVGGGIGPHTHPGTLVVVIESGQFGLTLAEDSAMHMVVMRAADAPGTPAAEEQLMPGQETILEPGDYFIETGMVHSARTVGEEPAIVTYTGLVEAGQPVTTCV
jgi:quercetin dioxygenase-like cupin family protein